MLSGGGRGQTKAKSVDRVGRRLDGERDEAGDRKGSQGVRTPPAGGHFGHRRAQEQAPGAEDFLGLDCRIQQDGQAVLEVTMVVHGAPSGGRLHHIEPQVMHAKLPDSIPPLNAPNDALYLNPQPM